MLKRLLVGAFILSFLTITGCTTANFAKVEKFPDLTKTENFIIKGESDTRAVREIFGTPSIILKTKKDSLPVYAYIISCTNDYGATLGENILHSLKTLGFGGNLKNGTTDTVKNVYFKINADNKVEDIKYNGFAWLVPGGSLTTYFFQGLTYEEIMSTQPLLEKDIVESYSNKNISEENIKKYDLSQVIKGIIVLQRLCFNVSGRTLNEDLLLVDEKPSVESYDGIKSSELFDKVEYTYK